MRCARPAWIRASRASRWSLDAAAQLKPPSDPVDLEEHPVHRQARVGDTANEYRLVARRG